MKNLSFSTLLLLLSAGAGLRGQSQVMVSGPTCVIPGTTYQYLITGPWDSASTLQVCLTGGSLAGTSASCTTTGSPVAAVLVTWKAGTSGNVQLSSTKGSITLAVTITSPLSGGNISTAVKTQSIAFKGTAAVITCSPSTGGSCSPNYQYQWQQSPNRLNWIDISGAQGQTLSLAQPLQYETFFRRKVTETGSGTIAYSDEALVNVAPPPLSATIAN